MDRIAPQDLLPHKTGWHLTTRCRSTSDKNGNQLDGRVIDGCTSTSLEALDLADANFLQLQETGVFPTEGAVHPQVREKGFRVPVSREPCDSMNHIHSTFQLNESNPFRGRWPRVRLVTVGRQAEGWAYNPEVWIEKIQHLFIEAWLDPVPKEHIF